MKLISVGAMALGAVLFTTIPLFNWYTGSLEPVPPVLERIDVNPRDEAGSVMVSVRYHITPDSKCIFLGFHSMWRPAEHPEEEGQRIFLLLGGTAVGPVIQTFAGTDFSVHFHLPSSVVPGTYHYTYRLLYQCGIYKLVPFMIEINAPVVIPPIMSFGFPSSPLPG